MALNAQLIVGGRLVSTGSLGESSEQPTAASKAIMDNLMKYLMLYPQLGFVGSGQISPVH